MVAQAQPVYGLAHDGARDAIFNVHEWALNNATTDKDLTISLVSDPSVKTVGDVREISPASIPKAKTSGEGGPAHQRDDMSLGALVERHRPMRMQKVVLVPWGALFEIGKPAVWMIDPRSTTVSTEAHRHHRYTKDRIVNAGRPAGRRESSSARA